MKRDSGKSVISFIISILIIAVFAFLFYEIVFMNVLGIMPNENSIAPISEISNKINTNNLSSSENINNISENIEQIEPIIENNLRKL